MSVLDVIKLSALISEPRGYTLIFKFIVAIRDGEIPRNEVTNALEGCFKKIIEEKIDPMKALDLKRKRGDKKTSSRNNQNKISAKIAHFIGQQLPETQKRGDLSDAIQKASIKFHKSTRQIEAIWRYNKSTVLGIKRLTSHWAERQKLAQIHFTPDELKQTSEWLVEDFDRELDKRIAASAKSKSTITTTVTSKKKRGK